MKEIKLTRGKVALVDDDDFEYLNQFKWHSLVCKYTYYAVRTIRINGERKSLKMHRKIMNVSINKVIDHIDGNGLNNQKENLRICSQSQNCMNRKRTYGSSKYKGVTVYKNNKNKVFIIARLMINRKVVLNSYHKNEIDAAKCYDAAAQKYYGEFANINFK